MFLYQVIVLRKICTKKHKFITMDYKVSFYKNEHSLISNNFFSGMFWLVDWLNGFNDRQLHFRLLLMVWYLILRVAILVLILHGGDGFPALVGQRREVEHMMMEQINENHTSLHPLCICRPFERNDRLLRYW